MHRSRRSHLVCLARSSVRNKRDARGKDATAELTLAMVRFFTLPCEQARKVNGGRGRSAEPAGVGPSIVGCGKIACNEISGRHATLVNAFPNGASTFPPA